MRRYNSSIKTTARKEYYDTGIYIRDIENIVAYTTDNYEYDSNEQEIEEKRKQTKKARNQILFNDYEAKKKPREK